MKETTKCVLWKTLTMVLMIAIMFFAIFSYWNHERNQVNILMKVESLREEIIQNSHEIEVNLGWLEMNSRRIQAIEDSVSN